MLTMKDVVHERNPILRQVAEEVQLPLSEEDKRIGEQLLEYVKNSKNKKICKKYKLKPSSGIAAPQIGISKRIIAVHTDKDGYLHSYVLFNPQILNSSVEKTFLSTGEGCLSVGRKIKGYVFRHVSITVRGINLDGEEKILHLNGYAAIVVQHEIDHLDGILFYDHIDENRPLAVSKATKPLLLRK